MSMEQNEPQTTQGQQTAPPLVLSPVQDGAFAATSNGPSQQQRRRRRRRKAGKSANPAQAGPGGPNGPSGSSALPGVGSASADPAMLSNPSTAAFEETDSAADSNRMQNREQAPSFSRDASGAQPSRDQQQPRQARNHQQNHYKKQQRQAKNASQGGSSQGGSSQGGSSQAAQGGSNQGRHFQKGGSQPREYNPGNAIAPAGGQPGNGGARRKNKVRRQAPGFVGPMDHSYRVVNGNIADGPPSTMDFRSNANGNGNGNVHGRNGYSDFLDAPIPVIIREDTPSRILCFIEDLFVVAKMQETARKLGVKVSFAKAEKDTIARLTDAPELERPSLIVFDLNNANAKPLTLIPKLKAKLKRGTSIIGFLSHIQGDLKMKAIEAGCDTVMPKAAFSQNLPNLLRRHGLDEELDETEGW